MTFLQKFRLFIRRQASAALFGGIMLAALLVTKYVSVPGIYRYDLLFIIALVTQAILIVTRLETPKEVFAIIVFHVCAMVMELYKTSPLVGSWTYPEPAVLAIGTVPLFTGFMYSSVGSYIARAWRINKFHFEHLPSRTALAALGLGVYVNFFTNYFTYDVRLLLFICFVILFWKTKFSAILANKPKTIHPIITTALMAFFIWIAEQVGTIARAWVYPNQSAGWQPVSFAMFTSWYMLIIFSFILIALLYNKEKE